MIAGRAKIALRNTFEYETTDGRRVTRLHLTDVCTRTPAKPRAKDRRERYTLDSGGYLTKTTKDRMNHALSASPYRVVSGRGAWLVQRGGWNGESVAYHDGITLPDAFEKPAAMGRAKRAEHATQRLQSAIKRFVDSKLANGSPIPQPSAGDCWHCLMFDREPEAGRGGYMPTCERSAKQRDAEHLRNHIREGYMHGSLIVNALRDRGTTDYGAAIYLRDTSPRNMRELRRIVRRYLQKRLGLPHR